MLITKSILRNLIQNEDYFRKVFPYIKEEYFDSPVDRVVMDLLKAYIDKYNRRPTQQVLLVDLESSNATNEKTHAECKALIDELSDDPQDLDWLVDSTEAWCKERAIYNALRESLEILEDNKTNRSSGEIPKLLEDAIAISFDATVGHDYFDDSAARFAYYNRVESKIPFDIKTLNDITEGGLPPKTLSVLMGGVHVGKTMTMCHMAAGNMMAGKNVLYITMEMSQEEIGKRIDANLLDIELPDIKMMQKEVFDRKVAYARSKTPGKLVIKEYPTAAANVLHFKHLLHELRFKKKFRPDIIYIDYMNICCSARLKMSARISMYNYVQSIAEEIRGLAVEEELPIVSATQLNREGFKSSDPGMGDVAESWAVPQTIDLMLVMIVTDELKELNQILFKQEKNRIGNINYMTKFILGRDVLKQRLFDVEKPTVLVHQPTVNTTAERFDLKKLEGWK